MSVGSGEGEVPGDHGRPLPQWFVVGFVATIVWCATAGTVGVAMLAFGTYNVGVIGAVATFASGLSALAAARVLGPRPHADHAAAVVAVALALGFFAFSSAFHSEHLLVDRDPAVYLMTGRSIVQSHHLRPKTHVGPFTSPAFGNPEARFLPNFFPMLPVLLAVGWSIGGDSGMLLVGPALGALAVLACYALASRLLGSRWALAALAFLMIVPPQIWFSRDAFSELAVQVVVLGGLWLFLEARARRSSGMAALSGALVASAALARIDALAIIVCTVVLAAAVWVRCDRDAEPVSARRAVSAFVMSLIAMTVVSLELTQRTSAGYIHALRTQHRNLELALAAAVVGLLAVVVVQRVRPGLGRWLAQRKSLFALAVAAGAGVFAWAYIWRPAARRDLPVVVPGHPPDAVLRRAIKYWHFTWSLHWFSAYFGVFAVLLAFVGFVLLAARARRGNDAAATVFLVVVPVAVMYVARPSIQADQPWAMRRFLPVVIPGIVIAIVVALEAGWRAARSPRAPVVRMTATLGVIAVTLLGTVPTVYAAVPFATARAQHGAQAVVHQICDVAGDDSAVLVTGGMFLDIELPQAVRAFCGVPTASANGIDLVSTANEWHAAGRRFLVAAAAPDPVLRRAPGAKIVAHFVVSDDADPERRYERSARRFAPRPVEIWLFEIPPNAG
jgi:hypothetical protein